MNTIPNKILRRLSILYLLACTYACAQKGLSPEVRDLLQGGRHRNGKTEADKKKKEEQEKKEDELRESLLVLKSDSSWKETVRIGAYTKNFPTAFHDSIYPPMEKDNKQQNEVLKKAPVIAEAALVFKEFVDALTEDELKSIDLNKLKEAIIVLQALVSLLQPGKDLYNETIKTTMFYTKGDKIAKTRFEQLKEFLAKVALRFEESGGYKINPESVNSKAEELSKQLSGK